MLTALGLESESAGHLTELASALHAAYAQVAAGLPGNTVLEVVAGKLKLAKLGKAEEPKLMPPFRQLVNGMLPKVDFPELLLEVAELTGMADAFTRISGAESHMEGFTTSLCAVLLTEVCNVGLTPVLKPDVPALPGTAGRSRRPSARTPRRTPTSSSACSRSVATSSRRGSPTSPMHGCGGRTPQRITGRSSLSRTTRSA